MILVMGGNGFIGYNLVKRFAQKEKVKVFDRTWTHGSECKNVELEMGNFQHIDFEKILEDVDTVFHFISSSTPFDGTDNLQADIEENLLPTVRLLDAMRKKKVKKYFLSRRVEQFMENVQDLRGKRIKFRQNVYMRHKRHG